MNTLVLIPTYNERENLARLIPAVLRHQRFRLLVIDDASPDGTGEVAEQWSRSCGGRVQVLRRTVTMGLGTACVSGMREALSQRPDLICQMDADGSHNPDDLPRLVRAAFHADLVIGSRYVPGGALVNWPRHRRALSRTANAYIRRTLGLRVRDCTAGFRCWRPALLHRIGIDTLRSNGCTFQVETLVRARACGASILEVPIVVTERDPGGSRMSTGVVLETLAVPWRVRGTRTASGSRAVSSTCCSGPIARTTEAMD